MVQKKILPVVLLAVLLLTCPVMAKQSGNENRDVEVEAEREGMHPVSSNEPCRKHPGLPGENEAPENSRDGKRPADHRKGSRPESGNSDLEDQPDSSGCSCRCVCGKDRSHFGENSEGSPREGGRPAPKHHQSKPEDRDSGSAHRGKAPKKPEDEHFTAPHPGEQRVYAF